MKNQLNNLALIGGDNELPLFAYDSIKKKYKDFKVVFKKIFNSNEIKTESIANNDTKNELTKNLIDFILADSSRGLCSFK